MASKTASHFVTKTVLGIDVNERYSRMPQDLDQRARETITPADLFLEQEPTISEFFKELAPSRDGVHQYFQGLFPSASWVPRYCLSWLLGDVTAGMLSGLNS